MIVPITEGDMGITQERSSRWNVNYLVVLMETQKSFYETPDLKLQAFLRLMLPTSFAGASRTSNRVLFQFRDSSQLQDLVTGYYIGQTFELSPFQFSTLIDQGKAIVFGRVDFDST